MYKRTISAVLLVGTLWGYRTAPSTAPVRIPGPTAIPDPVAAKLGHSGQLPPPVADKLSGSELLAVLREQAPAAREELIYEILHRGHFPDFLRTLRPVSVQEGGRSLTFWVMPEYVAIGDNEDYVLIPMNFLTAKKLARSWGMGLPTPKMVDAIHRQAERVQWPRTLKPGPRMMSIDYLDRHNTWILGQRFLFSDPTLLHAGHKKDIVLTRRLYRQPDRIAIYGWHRLRGSDPIQPLSLWHGERYVDYSHGVRLIGPWVQADGKILSLREALRDRTWARLLSSEGTIDLERLLREEEPVLVAQTR